MRPRRLDAPYVLLAGRPHLAGVHGKEPLAKLPEAEQESWRKLWADVEEVLKKAQEAKN